jgi:hypothetical protein
VPRDILLLLVEDADRLALVKKPNTAANPAMYR